MTDKLLPCPFCGGKAESIDNGKWEPVIDEGGAYVDCDIQDPTWYGVQCTKCFCQLISEEYTDKKEAIAAWNRRAAGWIPVSEGLPKQEEKVSDIYNAQTLMEQYKKALGLACEYIGEVDCPEGLGTDDCTCPYDSCPENHSDCWQAYFLQQAKAGASDEPGR